MTIAHTDPGQIAVPFAELVGAAVAWEQAGELVDAGVRAVPPEAPAGCGPHVGPALAARLERWRSELAAIRQATAAHATALHASAHASAAVDEIAARRFQ